MNYFMGKEFNREHFPAFDVSVLKTKELKLPMKMVVLTKLSHCLLCFFLRGHFASFFLQSFHASISHWFA